MGGEAWAENPRLVIAEPWHAFVRLWAACRGGMGGIAHWPDAGGVNDQAAWVVDGFAVDTEAVRPVMPGDGVPNPRMMYWLPESTRPLLSASDVPILTSEMPSPSASIDDADHDPR